MKWTDYTSNVRQLGKNRAVQIWQQSLQYFIIILFRHLSEIERAQTVPSASVIHHPRTDDAFPNRRSLTHTSTNSTTVVSFRRRDLYFDDYQVLLLISSSAGMVLLQTGDGVPFFLFYFLDVREDCTFGGSDDEWPCSCNKRPGEARLTSPATPRCESWALTLPACRPSGQLRMRTYITSGLPGSY